jgi:hypothetical protein
VSRPADGGGGDAWYPLTANGDPARGQPDTLGKHADAYAKIARQASEASTHLHNLCVDQFWDSDAGTAFKVRCDNLAAELAKVVHRFQTAADALNAYIPVLTQAQSDAAGARRLGDTAEADFSSIGYAYNPMGDTRPGTAFVGHSVPWAPTTLVGPPMTAASPDWRTYETAAGDWSNATRRAGEAAHLHDTSATTAARKITDVAEHDGLSDKSWTALDAQQRSFLARLFNPATVEQAILDLPITNPNGELNGGVNADLPTDPAVLQALLDDLRAKGVDPARYKALLDQYWVATAAQQAGIDLNSWDPQAGVGPNQGNINAVYTYYGKLFLDHPELQWAGMANMIGPSFAGGFQDIDMLRGIAKQLADTLNKLPGPAFGALPDFLKQLAGTGGNLSAAELGWFEGKFLAMQKHIFFDQAATHAAYVAGPPGNKTAYIDEMAKAGLFAGDQPPDKTQNAWHVIANPQSSAQAISAANGDLLYREQNIVIKDQYNQMYQHDGPVGKTVTYLMTAVGAASIPGTHTPGEYRPVTVGGSVTVPVVVGRETVSVSVQTPLPDFNITNAADRWNYVSNDTLPAYQKLLTEHPGQAHDIVASSVQDRIAQQRLSARWPAIADNLLWKDWNVQVHSHFHPGLDIPFLPAL